MIATASPVSNKSRGSPGNQKFPVRSRIVGKGRKYLDYRDCKLPLEEAPTSQCSPDSRDPGGGPTIGPVGRGRSVVIPVEGNFL